MSWQNMQHNAQVFMKNDTMNMSLVVDTLSVLEPNDLFQISLFKNIDRHLTN